MDKNSSSGGGLGLGGILGIVFIVLKLCKVIDWSWWWVVSPFWIPIALIIVGYLIYFIVDLISSKSKKDE